MRNALIASFSIKIYKAWNLLFNMRNASFIKKWKLLFNMRNALIASFSIKINKEMEVIIQYEKCLDCKF